MQFPFYPLNMLFVWERVQYNSELYCISQADWANGHAVDQKAGQRLIYTTYIYI